jgi:hypothetical protein
MNPQARLPGPHREEGLRVQAMFSFPLAREEQTGVLLVLPLCEQESN